MPIACARCNPAVPGFELRSCWLPYATLHCLLCNGTTMHTQQNAMTLHCGTTMHTQQTP